MQSVLESKTANLEWRDHDFNPYSLSSNFFHGKPGEKFWNKNPETPSQEAPQMQNGKRVTLLE